MYVPQSAACSVPNSQTPVSSSQIAASQQFLNMVDSLVANADSAMGQIVQRTDLNAMGQPMVTTPAGQIAPLSQQPVLSFNNAPSPPAVTQTLQRWPQMSNGRSVAESVMTPKSCYVVPPYAPPMPPLTLPPVGVSATPSPAQAPPASNFTPPTTGNVCIDIQKGYVQQSQVSPKQLADCSNKGYYLMGTRILDPALTMKLASYFSRGNLPNIADQPNVPVYDPKTMGLAGMVQRYRRGR
jgi:hypothetical protein